MLLVVYYGYAAISFCWCGGALWGVVLARVEVKWCVGVRSTSSVDRAVTGALLCAKVCNDIY